MNITATAVAVTLAVVIAIAFLFYGPNVLRPFQNAAETQPTDTQALMASSTDSTAASPNQPQAGGQASAALPTTLTVTDEVVGTGAAVKAGDVITVNYVGSFPDGTVFDASAKHAQPLQFPVGMGNVIKGWDQGLIGMKVGGKRHLVIPPDYGYGAQANGPIPANSTLVFEVELLKIGQ